MGEMLNKSWVPFYETFAKELLKFKDNRDGLIDLVKKVYQEINLKMPTLDKNNNVTDIDPFTIYGLFNKSSQKEENRIKIIKAFAKILNIDVTMPQSFDSVPRLNNVNALFYNFEGDRGENDIDELWSFFETVLQFIENKNDYTRENFKKYFDMVMKKKGIHNSKLTSALYWISPKNFVSIDNLNVNFILESEYIPGEIKGIFKKRSVKISGESYLYVVNQLQKYLQHTSDMHDFIDFSYKAWEYSKHKVESNVTEERGETIYSVDSKTTCQSYTKEDFLKEVFINETDYQRLVQLITIKKNVILQGPPGVGKTYAAKRLAFSMMGELDENRVKMIQFHQSYSYEDFIMGYRPTANGFELREGSFYKFCKQAEADSEHDYFFIIDEINRGNLSKIFGELFMLIENDKRGTQLELLYSDKLFSVPKNVYIIGMMNTADRSLAILDYALRRRFAFFEMTPSFEMEGFKRYQSEFSSSKFDALIECIRMLNKEITNDESLGAGFNIGHSYFCNLSHVNETILSNIIEYEIIPLLNEYWFDEPENVHFWSQKLRDTLHD